MKAFAIRLVGRICVSVKCKMTHSCNISILQDNKKTILVLLRFNNICIKQTYQQFTDNKTY